jgi:hypothetical protein
LPITPTRAGILKEIARLGIPELASPVVFELYKCIETDLNPTRIASNVHRLLDSVAEMECPAYSQYINSIKQTVAAKLVKQVGVDFYWIKCTFFYLFTS